MIRGGRLAAIVAAGLVAAAGVVAVSVGIAHAAFTDIARLDSRVSGTYENVIVDGAGTVTARYRGTHAASVAADQFAPGDTAVVRLRLAPNSPAPSAVRLAVVADSSVVSALRVSASREDESGTTVLLGDPTQPARGAGLIVPVDVAAGSLPAHVGAPAAVGDTVDAREVVTLTVAVFFTDDPTAAPLRAAHTTLTITVSGETVS